MIAGAAAEALRAPAAETPGYRRNSLRHSGVRRADGSPHPLALSRFRNAQFAPSAGDPAPVGLARLPGLSVFGGVLGRDFGHVVTQSIGRLWAGSLAPGAPILFLPETLEVTGIPAYFADLARGLGVSNDLRLVTTATLCNRLLVPEDICNLEHRPSASRFFVDWLAQIRARPDRSAAGTGRVYVSRSGLDLTKGQFLQEAAVEQALAANGYLVFHPEDHPVARQIEVYQSARHLIFADGSAAHLWSLVARPGQAAAVILRRPLDRPFERWFRSFGRARPAFVDGRIADLTRRGEGPQRSVAILDLGAVWADLLALGFHDDRQSIGIDRARLEAWALSRAPEAPDPGTSPMSLDSRSQQILAGCRHVRLRLDLPRPQIRPDHPSFRNESRP